MSGAYGPYYVTTANLSTTQYSISLTGAGGSVIVPATTSMTGVAANAWTVPSGINFVWMTSVGGGAGGGGGCASTGGGGGGGAGGMAIVDLACL